MKLLERAVSGNMAIEATLLQRGDCCEEWIGNVSLDVYQIEADGSEWRIGGDVISRTNYRKRSKAGLSNSIAVTA